MVNYISLSKAKENIIRDSIIGARNSQAFLIAFLLFFAGSSFFLAGLSSYLNCNLILFTDTRDIKFIPQGVALLFYGASALGIFIYVTLTIFFDVGSGFNEFSNDEKIVRIIRHGFPGKNREIFLSYNFKSAKSLKFLMKQGLNPRCNILLVLKDKREIPLFPAQFLLNPMQMEKKALQLSAFLKIPLEDFITSEYKNTL